MNLGGIVGHQTQLLCTQSNQNLCTHAIFTQIRGKAQLDVGIYRIIALLLQLIGTQLVNQTDTTAFLTQVQQQTAAFLVNGLKCCSQLLAAVTACRTKGITGQALRVYTAEHRLTICNITHGQGNMMLAGQLIDKAVNLKMSVFGGHICAGNFLHQGFFLVAHAVSDQVRNGNHDQIMLLGKLDQLGGTHHGAILPHNLTAQTNRCQTCQTAQVNGSFGMSRTDEYTAFTGAQGEHMSRTAEIRGLCLRIHRHHGSQRAFYCRNTGGSLHMVNGNGKSSFMIVRILFHHLGQTQLIAVITAHRHADQTLGMGCHEVDIFCGCKLCGTNDIAFVFTIRVINDQNILSGTERVQCLFNGCKISHGNGILLL